MNKLIKNYTTNIPTEKTINEIHQLIAKNGATAIATEYDANGNTKDIFFRIKLNDKELPFRLPAKPDKVYQALFSGLKDRRIYQNGNWVNRYEEERKKNAEKIAWRICKTWLEAQITLINLEQVKIEEVFLPYLVMQDNKTLFEHMQDKQFLLPGGQ